MADNSVAAQILLQVRAVPQHPVARVLSAESLSCVREWRYCLVSSGYLSQGDGWQWGADVLAENKDLRTPLKLAQSMMHNKTVCEQEYGSPTWRLRFDCNHFTNCFPTRALHNSHASCFVLRRWTCCNNTRARRPK